MIHTMAAIDVDGHIVAHRTDLLGHLKGPCEDRNAGTWAVT